MKQMQAKITGIEKLQGFVDVYQITLEVPDIYNGYTTNIAPVRICVGPNMIESYKRLYMTEEWFAISLPG